MDKTQNQLLEEFLTQWFEGGAIRAHTSGSTGVPKEILLPRRQVERSAKRTVNFFGIHRSSRLHSAISFNFIGGKMMIARSLVSGCDLTFSEPSLTPPPPKDGERVSLMAVVPAQMPHILAHPEEFRNVRNFLIGGSAIDDRLWDKIIMSGLDAWESYGMTETASHIALRRVAGIPSRRPRFVVLPGVELSNNFDGRLHIKDGDVFVVSNDIANIYADGSFEIIGRADDMIITGGLKIMPQRVEDALRPYLADLVEQFYISSEPDETWTSKIVIRCVASDKKIAASIAGCIDAVPENVLPKKFRPKAVYIIDALPLTSSGKLKRS